MLVLLIGATEQHALWGFIISISEVSTNTISKEKAHPMLVKKFDIVKKCRFEDPNAPLFSIWATRLESVWPQNLATFNPIPPHSKSQVWYESATSIIVLLRESLHFLEMEKMAEN